MNWKLAEAKQQLSKVVRLAQREPQILQNRDEPVAAVISADEFDRFREWQARSGKTLAVAFDELREIARDEDWTLEVVPRVSRPNALLDVGAVTSSAPKPAAKKRVAGPRKRPR